MKVVLSKIWFGIKKFFKWFWKTFKWIGLLVIGSVIGVFVLIVHLIGVRGKREAYGDNYEDLEKKLKELKEEEEKIKKGVDLSKEDVKKVLERVIKEPKEKGDDTR